MKAIDKKKEMASKIVEKAKGGKKPKYELGDDRHPDTIAAERRERKNPRYSRAGVKGLQY